MISADCTLDKACVNQKCQDPCPGTCGINARCQVVNHNPICSCSVRFTGDPFVRCIPEESKLYFYVLCSLFYYHFFLMHANFKHILERPVEVPSGNPCVPSPCGPNSQCRVVGNSPACSCLPNYIGRAPNCRPECVINEECPGNLACQNERCKDPCPGSCGSQATCVVVKHSPVCSCLQGYTGDPFTGCSLIISKNVNVKLYTTLIIINFSHPTSRGTKKPM